MVINTYIIGINKNKYNTFSIIKAKNFKVFINNGFILINIIE